MKILTITTIRRLSNSDYKEYKKQMMSIADIDWSELEKTGSTKLLTHQEGEDVITLYKLKQ